MKGLGLSEELLDANEMDIDKMAQVLGVDKSMVTFQIGGR